MKKFIKENKLILEITVIALILILIILFVLNNVFSTKNILLKNAGQEAIQANDIIVEKYPEYKDFDKKSSFAGTAIYYRKVGSNRYLGYVVNGSGLPIVSGRCFKVDKNNNVTYKDLDKSEFTGDGVDLINCKLVKTTKTNVLGESVKEYGYSNNISFSFHDALITLNKMGSGSTVGTFWETKFETVNDIKDVTEDDIVNKLYSKGYGNYYIPMPVDKYYEIKENYFRTLDYVNEVPENCNKEDVTISSKRVIANKCNNNITNCSPTINGYLEYKQSEANIDDSYDLCLELDNMGIQNW